MKESCLRCASGPGGGGGVGGQASFGTNRAGTVLWPCQGEALPPEATLSVADVGQLDQSVSKGLKRAVSVLAESEELSASEGQAETKRQV